MDTAIKSEVHSNWGINQTIEARQRERLQALKVLGEGIFIRNKTNQNLHAYSARVTFWTQSMGEWIAEE